VRSSRRGARGTSITQGSVRPVNETWNIQLVRWCPAQCPAQSLQRRCLLMPSRLSLASRLAVRLLPPINSPLAPLELLPSPLRWSPRAWNLEPGTSSGQQPQPAGATAGGSLPVRRHRAPSTTQSTSSINWNWMHDPSSVPALISHHHLVNLQPTASLAPLSTLPTGSLLAANEGRTAGHATAEPLPTSRRYAGPKVFARISLPAHRLPQYSDCHDVPARLQRAAAQVQ